MVYSVSPFFLQETDQTYKDLIPDKMSVEKPIQIKVEIALDDNHVKEENLPCSTSGPDGYDCCVVKKEPLNDEENETVGLKGSCLEHGAEVPNAQNNIQHLFAHSVQGNSVMT